MGNSDSVIPSEVRDLIQESQKIGGWVGRLADHSDDARPEVVEKVRRDYDDRLQTVNSQLAEHKASLTDTLGVRQAEVESLRGDRDEHAAELEEARLRHAVGEFSDSQWKKRKEGIEQTLEDLDALLALEEETVAELADIIGRIGTSGPRLVPADGGAVNEALADEIEDADVPAAEAHPAASSEPVEGMETSEDAEVGEVADPLAAEPALASETGSSEQTESTVGADADEGGEYLDELEFLESLSLGDSDRFDAVSAMLDDEEGGKSSD